MTGMEIGQRVGVAWIFSACGHCEHCAAGDENLCSEFRATGRDANGGYAEYMTVPAAFAHEIPDCFTDAEAAPLLCAGAVGYRSLRLAGIRNGMRLGLTGFGASGHLVMMMVRHRYPDTEVYVFARQREERDFALQSGAVWAGDTRESGSREAARHHRHDTGVAAGDQGAREPRAGRPAGGERDSQGRDGPAAIARPRLSTTPVDGKRDQERRERHAQRRARISRSRRRHPDATGGRDIFP